MWGFRGALLPYWQLFESPVCGGFAHFVAFALRNVGTQVFTGICGIRLTVIQINTSSNLAHGFKEANALILRC